MLHVWYWVPAAAATSTHSSRNVNISFLGKRFEKEDLNFVVNHKFPFFLYPFSRTKDNCSTYTNFNALLMSRIGTMLIVSSIKYPQELLQEIAWLIKYLDPTSVVLVKFGVVFMEF